MDKIFFPRGERKIDPFFSKERNLSFASQIRDALCAETEASTSIIVLVGDNHIAGILEHFKDWVGESFTYKYFKSSHKNDIEKLFAELKIEK